MMDTQEFVVPRSMPMTGPETLSDAILAPKGCSSYGQLLFSFGVCRVLQKLSSQGDDTESVAGTEGTYGEGRACASPECRGTHAASCSKAGGRQHCDGWWLRNSVEPLLASHKFSRPSFSAAKSSPPRERQQHSTVRGSGQKGGYASRTRELGKKTSTYALCLSCLWTSFERSCLSLRTWKRSKSPSARRVSRALIFCAHDDLCHASTTPALSIDALSVFWRTPRGRPLTNKGVKDMRRYANAWRGTPVVGPSMSACIIPCEWCCCCEK